MTTATAPQSGIRSIVRDERGDDVVTLVLGSHEYTVTLTTRPYSGKRSAKPVTKIFVSGVDQDLPNPPYGLRGDNPAEDARWDVYNSLEKAHMRAVLVEVVAAVGADATRLVEAKFSRKAGCSMCPCSPGFTLDGVLAVDGMSSTYRVVWVERKRQEG